MKRISCHSFLIVNLVFFFFVFVLAGCSSPKKVAVKPNEHMEVGWTPRTVFQSPSYALWFDTTYANYELNTDYTDRLRGMNENVEILVVYGMWCGDSKREMPRFFKIMDGIQFPSDRITLIAVDRTMLIPPKIKEDHGITNVPTFIVKYKGMEIGRIIELPKTSLEQDLFEMLFPFFPGS
jgi:thiol-disulfide isomerase/thioredoxin